MEAVGTEGSLPRMPNTKCSMLCLLLCVFRSEAKQLIASWFPGGIYATKYLANNLPAELQLADTSLGSLFTALTQPDTPQRTAANHAMGFLSSNLGMQLSLPAVAHAPGFDK